MIEARRRVSEINDTVTSRHMYLLKHYNERRRGLRSQLVHDRRLAAQVTRNDSSVLGYGHKGSDSAVSCPDLTGALTTRQ